MKPSGLWCLYVACLLLPVTGGPLAAQSREPGGAPAEIAVYPGATSFCSEHISGAPQNGKPGPHITWTGYQSSDPPEKVVAFYHRELGTSTHSREGQEDIWRLPLDRPERTVSVTTVKDAVLVSRCKKPPSSARTVVVISTMARP
jgi:hypothetical protein